MDKQKWEKIADNYILPFGDSYISYQGLRRPTTRQHSLLMDFLAGMFIGESIKQHKETALVNDGKFFILNGDFRKEYEKLVPKGWDACFKFYLKKREKHISQWSYDYFDREIK